MFPNTLNYQVSRDDRTVNQGGGVVLIGISRYYLPRTTRTKTNDTMGQNVNKRGPGKYVLLKSNERDEHSILELS